MAPESGSEGVPGAAAQAAPRMLLLGAPALHAGGELPFVAERRTQLLVLLALRAGEWVPREQIAGLLWPGLPLTDARRNLRFTLHRAREVPGTAGLESTDAALRWTIGTDLADFVAACRAGRDEAAIALRRGPLADGMDDPANAAWSDWLAAERQRVDAQWREALHRHLSALAEPAARAGLAERLLADDPLDERALGALLDADLALGRGAEARRRYRDYAARLASELGVEPSQALRERLFRATQAVAASAGGAPAVARAPLAAPGTGDAAAEVTRIVGRRLELREVASILAEPDTRLLTVLGPGGVGKSRLAHQVLADQIPQAARWPGGAHWIDLQDLDAVRAVVARLAGEWDATVNDAQDPIAQLARAAGTARRLVVLDNAEHIEGLPAFLAALLSAAPALVMLATSRTRLGVAGERIVPLRGLAVPDADSRDLEAAGAFDAVRLFERRASAAAPGFVLERHLDAVIRIVETVDGLPLAIELAAAWTRLLPPEAIAQDLVRSIQLLERDPGAAGLPGRPEHASMRAVLDSTWNTLAPRERATLMTLSVFRGGFDLAAAQAVADAPLPVLSSLVDRSLVQVDEAGRFALHPLVAAFAAAQAAEAGDAAAGTAARHAGHYARRVAEAEGYARRDHRAMVATFDAEFANVMAAWRHAVEQRRADLVSALAPGLGSYFDLRGRHREGVEVLRAALVLDDGDAEGQQALARARARLARLLHRCRAMDEALAVAQAGIELAERCGDRLALLNCTTEAGGALSVMGRWPESRVYFERALEGARADGDRPGIATGLMNLGICAKKDGRFDEALALYQESLALERELQRHRSIAGALNNIGVLNMERGDWAAARATMSEAVRYCEAFDVPSMLPYCENGLGLACYELGDLEGAERHGAASVRLARDSGNRAVEYNAGCVLARAAVQRRDWPAARERFRDAARAVAAPRSEADLLNVAMYYAELLRDRGDPVAAARVWRMVIAHPRAEAGLRGSSQRWLDSLPLDDAQRAASGVDLPSLDAVIEAILA